MYFSINSKVNIMEIISVLLKNEFENTHFSELWYLYY